MNKTAISLNDYRGIIEISGQDKDNFLQGIITNDIKKLTNDNSIYALILTPQGKILFDIFISKYNNLYLLDCQNQQKQKLINKLNIYKLRADVKINDTQDKYKIYALNDFCLLPSEARLLYGKTILRDNFIAYTDPRSIKLPIRINLLNPDYNNTLTNNHKNFIEIEGQNYQLEPYNKYQKLLIENLIPTFSEDIIPEEDFPLDFGFQQLNAIDFKKGCYVGQEVTTRVMHRNKIRKKPYLLKITSGIPPLRGDKIFANDKNAGYCCSSIDNMVFAVLNTQLEDGNLHTNSCNLAIIS